jgi:hypothetical protein
MADRLREIVSTMTQAHRSLPEPGIEIVAVTSGTLVVGFSCASRSLLDDLVEVDTAGATSHRL